jgi:hypothetical protein
MQSFPLLFVFGGAIMRGSGPVRWGGEIVYCYFTVGGGVARVRLSADEADRFDLVEGMRVHLSLPGQEPLEGLVVRVRREPPFAWVELTPLAPPGANLAG